MSGRRKAHRQKDLTEDFLAGDLEEDRLDVRQRFSSRSKHARQARIERTALLRAAESPAAGEVQTLPVGHVVQVFSLYAEVEHEQTTWLCVVRKTLAQLLSSAAVVGDLVRFRAIESLDEQGRPEAVIEEVMPRRTVLVREEGFRRGAGEAIVANAEQVLIVASLRYPRVKWGLVDRMIVAARSGGLEAIICLNKVDAADVDAAAAQEMEGARQILAHYESLGIRTIQTSVVRAMGIEALGEVLKDRTTVLAGHSGVGKSSLIRTVQPSLDLRIGRISAYNEKGIHTTTSARRYRLDRGGYVIDTPGIRQFGLWGVTAENLLEHFPDVAAGTAPQWRVVSYERILESISKG